MLLLSHNNNNNYIFHNSERHHHVHSSLASESFFHNKRDGLSVRVCDQSSSRLMFHKNVRVSPGGVQPYNNHVLAAGPGNFGVLLDVSHIYQLEGYHFQRLIQAHDKMITCIRWSPIYGNVLASSSCDQTIAVWDTKNGKKLADISAQ